MEDNAILSTLFNKSIILFDLFLAFRTSFPLPNFVLNLTRREKVSRTFVKVLLSSAEVQLDNFFCAAASRIENWPNSPVKLVPSFAVLESGGKEKKSPHGITFSSTPRRLLVFSDKRLCDLTQCTCWLTFAQYSFSSYANDLKSRYLQIRIILFYFLCGGCQRSNTTDRACVAAIILLSFKTEAARAGIARLSEQEFV